MSATYQCVKCNSVVGVKPETERDIFDPFEHYENAVCEPCQDARLYAEHIAIFGKTDEELGFLQ